MAQILMTFTLIAFAIVKIECSNPLSLGDCKIEVYEHPDMYPEDKIRQLLQASGGAFSTFFDNVNVTKSDPPHAMGRSDRFFLDETLCDSTQKIVRPRLLKDDKDVPRFIVNVKNSSVPFEQVVKLETCSFGDSSKNLPCKNRSAPLEDSKYVTGCTQKNNMIKLLYLTENGDKLEYGQFAIPSGCVCTYSRN